MPAWDGGWNGPVWRAWARLRMARPDLLLAVADLDEGCGVLRRAGAPGAPPPAPPWTDPAGRAAGDVPLGYGYLEAHRRALLHLVPPADLPALLGCP